MLIRKLVAMLFCAMAIIVVIPAGNVVMANGTLTETCDFVDANGTPSGLSLSVLRDYQGNWPFSSGTGTGSNLWTYEIKGPLSGINQLTALETVCSSPMPELGYSVPSGGQVIAPGLGDPTTGYGIGNWQEYVVRLAAAPDGNPAHYGFYTTIAGGFRNTSMQVKMGKALYYCRNIIGPECYQPKIATTTTQKIQLNPDVPNQYIIVTMRTDGSVVSVVDDTGTQLTWQDLSNFMIDGQPVTYLPDGTIMKTGDHSCYSYVYLGKACTKCY